jgi:hypothetical protein
VHSVDASTVIVRSFDISGGCSSYVSKNRGLLAPSIVGFGAHLLLKSFGVKFDEESCRNIASFNPAVVSSATPLDVVLVVSDSGRRRARTVGELKWEGH